MLIRTTTREIIHRLVGRYAAQFAAGSLLALAQPPRSLQRAVLEAAPAAPKRIAAALAAPPAKKATAKYCVQARSGREAAEIYPHPQRQM